MRMYLVPVMVVCFGADGMLLQAAGALAGKRVPWGNTGLAAALGALYGGACLLPGFAALGGGLWRLAALGLMGLVAYGWAPGAVSLFCVLDLACGALALAMGGPLRMLLAALTVALLCLAGALGKKRPVPVELYWQDRRERVLALQDTGNGLYDPVTGQQVLVVGPQVAFRLLGLSPEQLKSPVETLTLAPLPGLRLVPYRAVGGGGLMLALRLPKVRMGGVTKSALVAFAPEGLDGKEKFEALTGGII